MWMTQDLIAWHCGIIGGASMQTYVRTTFGQSDCCRARSKLAVLLLVGQAGSYRTRCGAELSAGSDHDIVSSITRLRAYRFDGFDHLVAINDLPEHYMPAVKPRRLRRAEEELAPVGVGPCSSSEERRSIEETQSKDHSQ
jgi:hypothetical protein